MKLLVSKCECPFCQQILLDEEAVLRVELRCDKCKRDFALSPENSYDAVEVKEIV